MRSITIILLFLYVFCGCGKTDTDLQQTTTIGDDIEAFINMQCEYDELRQLVTNLPYHLQFQINSEGELVISSAYAPEEEIPQDYEVDGVSNAKEILDYMQKLNINYIAHYDANQGYGSVPMVDFTLSKYGYSFINTSCDLVNEGLNGAGVAYHMCDNWYIVYPTPV